MMKTFSDMDSVRYKIGDLVRIDDYDALEARSTGKVDLGYSLMGFAAGFVGGMHRFCGKELRVRELILSVPRGPWYKLEGNDCAWSPDMFDPNYPPVPEPELDFEITENDLLNIL